MAGFSLPGFGGRSSGTGDDEAGQVLESAEAGESLHFGSAGQLLVSAVAGGGRGGGGGLSLYSAEARSHFRSFLTLVETEGKQAAASVRPSPTFGQQQSDTGFVTMSLSDVRGRSVSPPALFASPTAGDGPPHSPTLPHRERAGSGIGGVLPSPLFSRVRADSTSKKWA